MSIKGYLLSLPERVIRSGVGLGAGTAREIGELALPEGVRRGQLYQLLVDATLRFLIEDVGGAESASLATGALPQDFLARRTAGNVVEMLGVVAFRASPVWILAALADLCGAGRQLIPEIADALRAEGLLEPDAQFTSVDQLLDGLERTSSRLAASVNMPPLDLAGLRQGWQALREDARALPSASLPSVHAIASVWSDLKAESTRQQRTVFETSSVMALSAVRGLPGGVRRLSASARVGATRTGQFFANALLDHYTRTLEEMREVGYVRFARRQFRPYLRAAAGQFSPGRRFVTQRLLDWIEARRHRAGASKK